jgi:7-cyano-7-deazaguanine synthase
LDSVTLAHVVSGNGTVQDDLLLLSFDYGQRHRKELQFAAQTARRLHAEHIVIEMDFMAELLHGSALTAHGGAVPMGHYAADNMKATVVPNRNAIMLSIAYGIAVAEHASRVYTGVHAGDHAIYPDCRPEFIAALNTALRLGNEWADPLPILRAPFVMLSKTNIARMAEIYSVPVQETWSCYEGGDIHCGKCGTCSERRQALYQAHVYDTTPYACTWEETCEVARLDLHTGGDL